jgi:catechol 2,3-dioxygenase-like lactoylglutathione lyase family enzyme
MKARLLLIALLFLIAPLLPAARGNAHSVHVEHVGLTVGDMDRAVAFYTGVLTFERISDVVVDGREYELLTGVFGARARIVRLRLGGDVIELTEFMAPRGRPIPPDMRANDLAFQHAAIIVSDMDAAYARLRRFSVAHASTGPQTLPDWNPNAGGIRAFYFRDPDGHFLEILQFPPGKGASRWHAKDRLFIGLDHTAIVVGNTERALAFYRDVLGLAVAGTSENHEIEQERLNNVFGARLRITTLRAAPDGLGIELLEYLAPRDGRPAPLDLRANDIGHWQTTVGIPSAASLIDASAQRPPFSLVSPRVARVPLAVGANDAALVRDPDGHGVQVVSKPASRADIEETAREQRPTRRNAEED